MGDHVINAVVIGFFAMMIGVPAVALLSKNNQGNWDDQSQLRGQMRAKRWSVRDTVDNLKDFLIGKNTEVEHWPVAKTVPGILGVTGRGTYSWKAGSTIRPGDGIHVLMSVTLPQLPDGREGAIDEILLMKTEDSLWSATWQGGQVLITTDGVHRGLLPQVLTSDVIDVVMSWEHVQSVHFLDETVTLELDAKRSLDDTIEVLEHTETLAGQLINNLPASAWA